MSFKAHKVGTSGFSDVTVQERHYGVCAEAANNHNKYYTAELHEDKGGQGWLVYVHYGRVGEPGTKKEYLLGGRPVDEISARNQLVKLCRSKFGKPKCSGCGNRSDESGSMTCSGCGRKYNFKDYTKKYVPVDLAQAKTGSSAAQSIVETDKLSRAAQAKVTTSGGTSRKTAPAVDPSIAGFLRHLFEEAGRAVRGSLNTGALRSTADNPLGTLSQAQIDSGAEILDEARQYVNAGRTNGAFMNLTSGWYSTIPQAIGRNPDWQSICLDTQDKITAAYDLLDLLKDVKGVQDSFKGDTSDHDRLVQVGAEIEVVDPNSKEYKDIAKMCHTTSRRHAGRFGRAKVRRIFKVRVKGQGGSWFDPKNVGNHQLMFHGSRNANMLGITSKGLLMRPPGAVVTGSMFGNALYFSPHPNDGGYASKSLQYAMGGWAGTRNQSKNCYLFIVNVAQGRVKRYWTAQPSLTSAPRGYHSVRGEKGRSLIHDEHMIYDIRQHRIEYVVDMDPGYR